MNILMSQRLLSYTLVNSTKVMSLHQIRRNQFGILQVVKGQITKGSIYRAIGICASIQIISTYVGNYIFDRGLTLSIGDFYDNTFLKENQQFQLAGVIKPGTIQIKRGTLEIKFTLTDFEREVEVFYRGPTKFEFKEGETLILTSYLPDINNKSKVIGLDYLTKHSMDGTNWEDKIGASRKNYGVNTKLQQLT